MSVVHVTAVKYDVLEHILQEWLVKTFGDEAQYEAASDESLAGYWKVTAPRKITEKEQHHLKKKGLLKKRRTLEH
ncbi:hypothetical protein BDZ45DRAFT_669191 [Acephala macrosclerotiorum]|nr:hypothetical protein BDZ45DRAFT_669191 [Acephala macrosclerotiorum]